MGGPGSGNWFRWSTRPVDEDGLTFDLYRLIRQGSIAPGKTKRDALENIQQHLR